MIQLTSEQLTAAEHGEAVRIEAGGRSFVLLSRAAYEDELDFSPWSEQEMNMLAEETTQYLSQNECHEAEER